RRETVIAVSRSSNAYINTIFNALSDDADPFLTHAVIHALIENGLPNFAREGLHFPSDGMRRAALIALDQMKDGNLTKQEVLPFLLATNRPLQQAAWQIVMKHTDWFGDVTGLIRKELQAKLPEERRELLRDLLISASQSLTVELFIAETLADKST